MYKQQYQSNIYHQRDGNTDYYRVENVVATPAIEPIKEVNRILKTSVAPFTENMPFRYEDASPNDHQNESRDWETNK